jgi:valyl-tRNA synthetase
MNTEGHDCGQQDGNCELNSADHWILTRLQETTDTVRKSIESYRFDHAAQAIYEFTWNEYCDWYLELSKPVLYSDDSSDAQLRGTRQTLVQVLESLLRLAHPVMPFITEEIWQRVSTLAGKSGETIMLQAYPESDPRQVYPGAVDEIQWIMDFVLGIRKIRSGMNIKPGMQLPVLLQNASEQDQQRLQDTLHYLKSLARVASVSVLTNDEAPESATALVGEMKVLIPMAGLIDVEEEKVRLTKDINKREQEIARTEAKLNNENFTSRAPAEVVDKERKKLDEARKALQSLKEQLARIEKI